MQEPGRQDLLTAAAAAAAAAVEAAAVVEAAVQEPPCSILEVEEVEAVHLTWGEAVGEDLLTSEVEHRLQETEDGRRQLVLVTVVERELRD